MCNALNIFHCSITDKVFAIWKEIWKDTINFSIKSETEYYFFVKTKIQYFLLHKNDLLFYFWFRTLMTTWVMVLLNFIWRIATSLKNRENLQISFYKKKAQYYKNNFTFFSFFFEMCTLTLVLKKIERPRGNIAHRATTVSGIHIGELIDKLK